MPFGFILRCIVVQYILVTTISFWEQKKESFVVQQDRVRRLAWCDFVLCLASKNTGTRADYMGTGSVASHVSGDESTQVNLSPGAKHRPVGGHTLSPKVHCSSCHVKTLHVNCVIAGEIHL